MLEKSSINEALFYPTSNQLVYEAETNHHFIDCYPYAVQGIVFGLLLSTIFWGSMIGLLMLVF